MTKVGKNRKYFNISIPKWSHRSLDKNKIVLPEANVVTHKLPLLLNRQQNLDYENSYASFLPLIWKTWRKICSTNQSVSHRYVAWITSTFKGQGKQKTNITFLPPINNRITQFNQQSWLNHVI